MFVELVPVYEADDVTVIGWDLITPHTHIAACWRPYWQAGKTRYDECQRSRLVCTQKHDIAWVDWYEACWPDWDYFIETWAFEYAKL